MIKVPYPEQDILDNYCGEIKAELLNRIKNVKSQKTIIIDKKTFRVTNKIKRILEYLENENNLEKLIKLKPKYLVILIKKMYIKFPKFHYKKE